MPIIANTAGIAFSVKIVKKSLRNESSGASVDSSDVSFEKFRLWPTIDKVDDSHDEYVDSNSKDIAPFMAEVKNQMCRYYRGYRVLYFVQILSNLSE